MTLWLGARVADGGCVGSERFSRGGQVDYVKVRKLFTSRRLEALWPIREDEVTVKVESVHKVLLWIPAKKKYYSFFIIFVYNIPRLFSLSTTFRERGSTY
jgi:hypothetical protein